MDRYTGKDDSEEDDRWMDKEIDARNTHRETMTDV